jgi:septal ring factor EnvC (AmiA/AmiB activator)
MSDELLPQAGDAQGQEPSAQDGKTASELERARKEAAKYRTERNELKARLDAAEPVLARIQEQENAQKTEAQKLGEQLAALQQQLADQSAAAQRAQRETALTRLAAMANVDLDILPLLDVSKIDLDDEAKALETLGKFAATRKAATAASDPGRGKPSQPSNDELRHTYFGGGRSRPTIFGG